MSWIRTSSGLPLWIDDDSGKVQLRDVGGRVFQFDRKGAESAVASGDYRPVTPGQVEAYDKAKKHGTAGAMLKTGAESLAAGAIDVVTGPGQILGAAGEAAGLIPRGETRKALGGRQVLENIGAVGAEATGFACLVPGQREGARQTRMCEARDHYLSRPKFLA